MAALLWAAGSVWADLRVEVIPSLLAATFDPYEYKRTNSEAAVPVIEEVYLGQEFRVFLTAEGYDTDWGKGHLDYEITITSDATGKPFYLERMPYLKGEIEEGEEVRPWRVPRIRIPNWVKPGTYTLTVKVIDRMDRDQTARMSRPLLIREITPAWSAVESEVIDDWLAEIPFPPEKFADALVSIDQNLGEMPTDMNLGAAAFLDEVLAENPFLVPMLQKRLPDAQSTEETAAILFLLLRRDEAFSLEDVRYPGALARAEGWLDLYESIDPYEGRLHPATIDMLWGEVYATGAFRPFARIVEGLNYWAFADTEFDPDEPGDPESLEFRVNTFAYLFHQTYGSVASAARESPLIYNYGDFLVNPTTTSRLSPEAREVLAYLLFEVREGNIAEE